MKLINGIIIMVFLFGMSALINYVDSATAYSDVEVSELIEIQDSGC